MKKIIALSAIAFLSTSVFAAADADARIAKLEKKLAKLTKKVGQVNAQAAKDNIKFDVDFRTAVDQLNYKMADGTEYKNDGLLTNRLWLNMGYAPTDNMVFKGQLAVHKAFGASYNQRATGMGFDTFDWVINENLTDETVRLREAYWLYTDNVGGLDVTASVGRRPATNGHLGNFREDDAKEKSPNAHVINMEFDGASASIKSDAILPGLMFKLCVGRGLTNAASWSAEATNYSQMSNDTMAGLGNPGASIQPQYTVDNSMGKLKTVDMMGFIFVPYDDGQYSVKSTWYRGTNLPGMYLADMDFVTGAQTWMMQSGGSIDGAAVSFKAEGLGDGISDFLDETKVFASYAMTTTDPTDASIYRSANAQMAVTQMGMTGAMQGSGEKETGTSIWVGTQMPNMTGGTFGLEYNKGSEYWRPFTYGEDTMIGSKIATRGTAVEAYWTQPLIENVFSMQVRYTQINYDYTGSNGFFGDGSMPMTMEMAQMMQMNPVESASDLRVYFRYRY